MNIAAMQEELYKARCDYNELLTHTDRILTERGVARAERDVALAERDAARALSTEVHRRAQRLEGIELHMETLRAGHARALGYARAASRFLKSRMREQMLAQLEWDSYEQCPICLKINTCGHSKDCALAEALWVYTGEKRSAVAYIEQQDGLILCVWNTRYSGWSMPGGLVEDGETVEEALVREVREEVDLEVVSATRVFTGPHKTAVVPEGRQRGSIVHVYRVAARGTPRAVETRIQWMSRDQFLETSPFSAFYKDVFAGPLRKVP